MKNVLNYSNFNNISESIYDDTVAFNREFELNKDDTKKYSNARIRRAFELSDYNLNKFKRNSPLLYKIAQHRKLVDELLDSTPEDIKNARNAESENIPVEISLGRVVTHNEPKIPSKSDLETDKLNNAETNSQAEQELETNPDIEQSNTTMTEIPVFENPPEFVDNSIVSFIDDYDVVLNDYKEPKMSEQYIKKFINEAKKFDTPSDFKHRKIYEYTELIKRYKDIFMVPADSNNNPVFDVTSNKYLNRVKEFILLSDIRSKHELFKTYFKIDANKLEQYKNSNNDTLLDAIFMDTNSILEKLDTYNDQFEKDKAEQIKKLLGKNINDTETDEFLSEVEIENNKIVNIDPSKKINKPEKNNIKKLIINILKKYDNKLNLMATNQDLFKLAVELNVLDVLR